MRIIELLPDDKNANKGRKRGMKAVEDSLKQYGAGRSILVDRNGKIIAGNKTAANAMAAGIDEVVLVPSDGTKIIAVQRTDLDLDSPEGRALAIADNRASELGLEWNPEVLGQFAGELDLESFFTGDELTKFIAPSLDSEGKADTSDKDTEIDVDAFELAHSCPRCGFEFNAK